MFTWQRLSSIVYRWRRPQPAEPRSQPPSPAEGQTSPRTRKIKRQANPGLDPSLPAFGPLHCIRDDPPPALVLIIKEETWLQVVRRGINGGQDIERAVLNQDNEAVMDVYITAMRRIEAEARNCYDEVMDDRLTPEIFELMMIKDGCFFLHLALQLLGVEFTTDHGVLSTIPKMIKTASWRKALLTVGNQIPTIVIKELMKQAYFQNIVRNHRWEKPRDLFRMALYDLLLSPAAYNWVDLLHGLQCMVLGENPKTRTNIQTNLPDIELGDDDINDIINDGKQFLSATEMDKSGIKFRAGPAGSRGIKFTTGMFWSCLSLPSITVDHNTEIVFQNLVEYEALHEQQSNRKREVTSFLRLMKDMVHTREDIRILERQGIILAVSLVCKENLLGILARLNCGTHTTRELHTVRLLTSNYTRPATWKRIKLFFNVLIFLSIVQTVYAILTYHVDHPRHHSNSTTTNNTATKFVYHNI